MLNETFRTATREYRLTQHTNKCFSLQFRVINKKTGKPWQAVRRASGTDCYQLANWRTNEVGPVLFGSPANADWGQGTPWNSFHRYFSTREIALRAGGIVVDSVRA